MEKYILLLIIIILVTPGIRAKESEFNTGITYNSFVYELNKDGETIDYTMREDLNSGFGYYGEGVFWLNNKLGIGLGVDFAKAVWEGRNNYSGGDTRDFEYSSRLVGPYTTVKYKLNKSLIVNLDIVHYNYQEHFQADYSWDKENFKQNLVVGDGLGVKIGTEFNYKINNSFYLIGKSYFRQVKINLEKEYDDVEETMKYINNDEELNITGLEVSFGINYKF